MPHNRMKLDQQLSSWRNSNSKWISILHLTCKPPELPEENVGNAFQVIGTVKTVLARTPAAQEMGPRINTWADVRLKCFFTSEKTIIRTSTQPTEWGEIFAVLQTKFSYTSNRRLMSTIYKELKQLKNEAVY